MGRIDSELVKRSFIGSRNSAQQIIKNGIVFVNGKKTEKPSLLINEGDVIEIRGELPRYVGRGGLKLEGAIDAFGIDLNGKICIDVGASTGGFTDCMLQNGAKRVYAVDVGSGQLDKTLREDSRVISLEKTDIRSAYGSIGEKADFISADVSFISLRLVIPEIKKLLKSGGSAVALIKPQFEVGKDGLGKNGIVKKASLREKAVKDISFFSSSSGFRVNGVIESPITGGDGNIEYLIHLLL